MDDTQRRRLFDNIKSCDIIVLRVEMIMSWAHEVDHLFECWWDYYYCIFDKSRVLTYLIRGNWLITVRLYDKLSDGWPIVNVDFKFIRNLPKYQQIECLNVWSWQILLSINCLVINQVWINLMVNSHI